MATSKKRTTKSSKKARASLPGSIYLNKKRYWWKVQLPGEAKAKARPLKPIGSKFATTDYSVAFEVATNIWQESIYKQSKDADNPCGCYSIRICLYASI